MTVVPDIMLGLTAEQIDDAQFGPTPSFLAKKAERSYFERSQGANTFDPELQSDGDVER